MNNNIWLKLFVCFLYSNKIKQIYWVLWITSCYTQNIKAIPVEFNEFGAKKTCRTSKEYFLHKRIISLVLSVQRAEKTMLRQIGFKKYFVLYQRKWAKALLKKLCAK